MKERKMYLDVDGVLVVWDDRYSCIAMAEGYGRLMRFCKLHDIQPYFLTMWSKQPDTLKGLQCLLWPTTCPTMAVPEIIEYGDDSKSSAIDYESDFVWIEDGIGVDDVECLKRHGALDRFFWTDGHDVMCLLKFMDFTRQKLNLRGGENWQHEWQPAISDPGPPPWCLHYA